MISTFQTTHIWDELFIEIKNHVAVITKKIILNIKRLNSKRITNFVKLKYYLFKINLTYKESNFDKKSKFSNNN